MLYVVCGMLSIGADGLLKLVPNNMSYYFSTVIAKLLLYAGGCVATGQLYSAM